MNKKNKTLLASFNNIFNWAAKLDLLFIHHHNDVIITGSYSCTWAEISNHFVSSIKSPSILVQKWQTEDLRSPMKVFSRNAAYTSNYLHVQTLLKKMKILLVISTSFAQIVFYAVIIW